ncbi:MAG: deoxyribose-phosphate aldolase [Lachnospiraceae bacterium]
MDISRLTAADIAGMIDHTNLKAFARREDIEKLCREAADHHFKTVCVNPSWITYCRELLEGSGVDIATVIGFPLGQMTIASKAYEAKDALMLGANELDYVINVSKLKDGDLDYFTEEMKTLTYICRERGALVKVILETCYLTEDEIKAAVYTANLLEPDFLKTSTGFGTGGARAEDVALMRSLADPHIRIKAAGGIRTWADCKAMIEAGAERIGASAGLRILEEYGKTC